MSPASPPPEAPALPAAIARAEAARAAGRTDDALAALGIAAALSPNPAPLLHDRGYLELAAGRYAAAAASFEAATRADAGFALAHLRLGVARQALDDPDGALAAYARAAVLDPARADAPYRAGALLASLGRADQAERAFRTAASAAPASALGRLAAARLAHDAHDHPGAERTLRALLQAYPGHLEATERLATLLAERGERDAAAAHFATVVEASPHYAGSFHDLALCRPITAADAELVARLQALAARGGTHPDALQRLHLGLGRAADQAGDPRRAMRHYDAASALRDPPLAASARALVAHAARARTLFARPSPRAADTATITDRPDAPILVLGLPRSGTTLVEHILTSHPDVRAGGEQPFWSLHAPLGPEALPTTDDLHLLAARYRDALARLPGPGRRATDKAPLNLLHAGLIHAALPDARIVLCRRRPIDVALSIHRTSFNRLAGFPTGGQALVDVIRALEALADHWRATLPPDRLLELRHERLATEPHTEIPALLAFCGLPPDPACLTPERNARAVRTPSKWQVRHPIAAPDPNAWRRYDGALGPLAALRPV